MVDKSEESFLTKETKVDTFNYAAGRLKEGCIVTHGATVTEDRADDKASFINLIH